MVEFLTGGKIYFVSWIHRPDFITTDSVVRQRIATTEAGGRSYSWPGDRKHVKWKGSGTRHHLHGTPLVETCFLQRYPTGLSVPPAKEQVCKHVSPREALHIQISVSHGEDDFHVFLSGRELPDLHVTSVKGSTDMMKGHKVNSVSANPYSLRK